MPPWSMRTYVDVILRVSSGGTETPKAIILPDGRTFEDTTGWNGPRWYVVTRGATAPVFDGVEGEWMP